MTYLTEPAVRPVLPTVAACLGPTDFGDPAAIDRVVREALGALPLPPDLVRPGDRVVLKPNWIKEHDERHPSPGHWQHVITHPTVIEAVIRWTAERLQGSGSIVVCDAPQTDSSFRLIREYCQLDAMIARCRTSYPGLRIELLDLRPEEWLARDGVTVARTALPGDPAGSTHVRLDAASEFVGYQGEGRLYGASYDAYRRAVPAVVPRLRQRTRSTRPSSQTGPADS